MKKKKSTVVISESVEQFSSLFSRLAGRILGVSTRCFAFYIMRTAEEESCGEFFRAGHAGA